MVRIEHDGDVTSVIYVNSEAPNEEAGTQLIKCRAAILAAPPKVLADTIDFYPPLPKVKIDSMFATPTWMEDFGKVAVTFPFNWWRQLNMSAVSIDQSGSVSTWWEACSGIAGDGLRPTLAGFVTASGAKSIHQLESAEALHDHVMDSLANLYGVDATTMGMQANSVEVTISGSEGRDGLVIVKQGISVTYKSWLKDVYTSIPTSSKIESRCEYGDVNLQKSVGSIFFAGTETSYGSGHMEGAVISGQRAAREVLQYLRTSITAK